MSLSSRFTLAALSMACLGAFALGSFSPLPLHAFALQSAQEEADSPRERKPPRGRVPNGFGKLGLTDVQRGEIYKIQAKYKDQVEELERQLEELKLEEFSEIHNVLTEVQKEAFRKYLEERSRSRSSSGQE